ncbi:hypothetical protein RRG08_038708 [Elysia crispata]|uniref:Uncharacterized protein n=1 Tax=Elysia crispata TaxID=231223 RepID=A0AAE0ZJC1_9GAST|nr:hypothetical protein RRG08_038708 [Elysia crispata]
MRNATVKSNTTHSCRAQRCDDLVACTSTRPGLHQTSLADILRCRGSNLMSLWFCHTSFGPTTEAHFLRSNALRDVSRRHATIMQSTAQRSQPDLESVEIFSAVVLCPAPTVPPLPVPTCPLSRPTRLPLGTHTLGSLVQTHWSLTPQF